MNERQKNILAFIEKKGESDIASMTSQVGASEATIRRDLTILESAGKLVRTFGGARLAATPSLVARTFEEKRKHLREEKEKIACAAARFVEPGMVIAMDSGTTVWRIAAALKEKMPLTILTTALAVVEELGAIPDISVHLGGGTFRLDNLDFVGPSTISAFSSLRADIAFLSADSFIPGRGAFAFDTASAAVVGAIQNCADKRILAIDHTKFNAGGCYLALASDRIDYLITDTGLSEEVKASLTGEPYKSVVAE